MGRVLVLGDLVGYGAEPNAVVDRVRALEPVAVIRGNHDKAACGLDDGSYVQSRRAARGALDPRRRSPTTIATTCARCRMGPMTIDDGVEICHGAPFDEDHYIFDAEDARGALDAATRPLCLFGHTHLPVVFRRDPSVFDGVVPDGAETAVALTARRRST